MRVSAIVAVPVNMSEAVNPKIIKRFMATSKMARMNIRIGFDSMPVGGFDGIRAAGPQILQPVSPESCDPIARSWCHHPRR